MASLLAYAGLALVSTLLVWKGSELLEEASESLAAIYGLPAVVRGALVAAMGSSFPELASVVLAAVRHGTFDLGVGAVVGSAVFNVLVIPALSAVGSERLDADRDVVYKEAQFYMLSISVLLLVFALGVIYSPPDSGRHVAVVDRSLALIPLGLYALYLYIQYLDTRDQRLARDEETPPLPEWTKLLVGLALIALSVEGLITAALGFGERLGADDFLWGVTVVAVGTSVPDALVSYRAARKGAGVASLSNVLGSNVFDLLVAIPVGVLLVGATTVNFGAAVPLMGYLTVATIALFVTTRTKLVLTEREAASLLAIYAAFLGWMVAETLGAVSVVPA